MSKPLSTITQRLLLAVAIYVIAICQVNAQSTLYKEAFSAYQTQNFSTAETIWSDLASSGDVNAQYALGVMHLRKEASDSSAITAFIWFEKASNQGHATAMFNLGVAY